MLKKTRKAKYTYRKVLFTLFLCLHFLPKMLTNYCLHCLHCLFIEYQTVKYNLQFLTKKIFYYSKIIIIFAL